MSLVVFGAAMWFPDTVLAQLATGGGGGTFNGGAVTGATSFLDGANFQVKNTADQTKILQFDVSGVTTGNTVTPFVLSGTSVGPAVLYDAGSFLMSATGVFTSWSGGSIGFASNATLTSASTADVAWRRLAAGVMTQRAATTTSIGSLSGGGANVASADPLPVPTGLIFHVTGTTNFTNITTTNMVTGACFTIIFDGILTVTDGGNLKLLANYVTTADDTLTLCFDGTNYYELSRSAN